MTNDVEIGLFEAMYSCLVPPGYPLDAPGPVRRLAFWNRWGKAWPSAEQQPDDGWQHKWVGG